MVSNSGELNFPLINAQIQHQFQRTNSVILNEPWENPKQDEVFHPSILASTQYDRKDVLDALLPPSLRPEETSPILQLGEIFRVKETEDGLTIDQNNFSFPLRIKPIDGGSGKGQKTIHQASELKEILLSNDLVYTHGIIVEPALIDYEDLAFQFINTLDNGTIVGPTLGQITDEKGDWEGSYFGPDIYYRTALKKD